MPCDGAPSPQDALADHSVPVRGNVGLEFDGEVHPVISGRRGARIGVMDGKGTMVLRRQAVDDTPFNQAARRFVFGLGCTAVLYGGDARFRKVDDTNVEAAHGRPASIYDTSAVLES